MPSYAVLGATGNTGLCLLSVLSQSSENIINAYCRSKNKLLRLSPEASKNDRIQIYEGDLENIPLIASCISGTRAVFLVVAVQRNVPGCHIAQDSARVIVSAMQQLREQKPNEKLPRLVVLSSSSIEPHLCRNMPGFVHAMLFASCSNIYKDLIEAEKLLRSDGDWITSTFIKPGGLSHDKQKGHKISFETQQTPLGWLDLAAGMVEVADADDETYDMKNVSVLPTATDVAFPWYAPLGLFQGLLIHFFPGLYPYLCS